MNNPFEGLNADEKTAKAAELAEDTAFTDELEAGAREQDPEALKQAMGEAETLIGLEKNLGQNVAKADLARAMASAEQDIEAEKLGGSKAAFQPKIEGSTTEEMEQDQAA